MANDDTDASAALLLEWQGSVALLKLNRPAQRNTLVEPLYRGLAEQLAALQDDPACRAVVLSGGAHFCAGGALDGLPTEGLAVRAAMRCGQRVVRSIVTGRLPVVAAVEGSAFGAGLSLAAACDFVVADDTARFGAVYGKVGLVPDWGALWTLPQRMGLSATRRLCLFGEVLNAQQAVEAGLVDERVPSGEALSTAMTWARRLADAAPGAIAATKTGLARAAHGLDALLDWEADAQALLITSADFDEGRNAFRERRTPRFEGR